MSIKYNQMFYTNRDSSLFVVMDLEYQVIMKHSHDDADSSLSFLMQPKLGVFRDIYVRRDAVYMAILEECTARNEGIYRAEMRNLTRPLSISTIFSELGEFPGLENLETRYQIRDTDSLGYVQASQTDHYCNKLHDYAKCDPSDLDCIAVKLYLWRSPEFDSSLPNTFKLMPRHVQTKQNENAFAMLYIPWMAGRTESVRVWSFHNFPFNQTGSLSANTISIYIPQQDCRDRQSDLLTIYDGPYAGLLTPTGLQSPFSVLGKKTCRDLLPEEAFNSSLGDVSLLWSNPSTANADISFIYFTSTLKCPGQFCGVTAIPVSRGYTNTTKFISSSTKPFIHILKFSGIRSGTHVKLRIWVNENSFPNYVPECRVAGLFLVETKLKASICSDRALHVLNFTMEASGIQFGPEVWVVVKSYPISSVVVKIEYDGTDCFGLVNVCINTYNPIELYNYPCSPQLVNYDSSSCIYSPTIAVESGSYFQFCCIELTDIISDLLACKMPENLCSYTVLHQQYRLFEVQVSAAVSPRRTKCCGVTVGFSDQPGIAGMQGTEVCGRSLKPVYTTSFSTKFPLNYRIIDDNIPCSIRRTVSTLPRLGKDICTNSLVGQQYDVDQQRHDQSEIISYSIHPRAHCGNTVMNSSYTVLLAIKQEFLFDGRDKSTLTSYDIDFRAATLENPAQLSVGWSPVILDGSRGPQCSWNMEMVISDDAHFRLLDSLEDWLDQGVTLTLTTTGYGNEIEISYTRKMKKYIMMATEHVLSAHTFEPDVPHCVGTKCYTGFDLDFQNVSWLEARDYCQREGHQLVTINSENEWLTLAHFLFEKHRCTDLSILFLGLSNQEVRYMTKISILPS